MCVYGMYQFPGIDTFSRHGFAFLAYNVSWIYRMPYLPLWYLTQNCFWSRKSLQSKRSVAIGPGSGIHWSYHGSHHFGAAGLTEQQNGLFKTQLQRYLHGNTLQAKGNVLQEALYALDGCPVYGAVSLRASIHGPGIKRWKWQCHDSLFLLVIH